MMNRESLLRRRDRTRAIVEGALISDIAIVFLLMRAFLPLPGIRQLLSAVAAVPFVMLVQRRGLKLTVVAGVASFLLFSALVGPILAMAAINVAVAGTLAGLGRKARLGIVLNLLWTGPLFAFFTLFLPTVVSVIVFRYPVKKLIEAARNFYKSVFNLLIYLCHMAHAPASWFRHLDDAKAWSSLHWQVGYGGSLLLLGYLTMYLAVLVSEMVLKQIPEQTLLRQGVTM